MEIWDLTSLRVATFRRLVPPFEAVCQAHMAKRHLDDHAHTSCHYTPSQNCRLPTPEDERLLILVPEELSGLSCAKPALWFNRDELFWLPWRTAEIAWFKTRWASVKRRSAAIPLACKRAITVLVASVSITPRSSIWARSQTLCEKSGAKRADTI